MEALDRAGPVGTGLEDVADPALLDPSTIVARRARHPVELAQKLVVDAIVLAVALEFLRQRLVLPERLPEDRVGAGADAGLVAVLHDDRLAGREGLLAINGGLDHPAGGVKRPPA